eukprot:UN13248
MSLSIWHQRWWLHHVNVQNFDKNCDSNFFHL